MLFHAAIIFDMWVELMLVLVVAAGVFLQVLQFSSLHIKKYSKFQWKQWNEEPPCGMPTAKFSTIITIKKRGLHNTFKLSITPFVN